MARVPFLNLPRLFEQHRDEFVSVMLDAAEKSHFVGGEALQAFEQGFARWLGPGLKAVGCGNGTDAIELVARAMRLPKDAEALIPAMTFVATIEGLHLAGVRVRLVDVDPATGLMTPALVEKAMTPATRLVVPVHLYGQMAPTDALRAVADAKGAAVLEDAAQAHGASWKGRPPGSWGKAATFSFFPSKNLGAFGDGGAVVSQDEALLDRVAELANHGGRKKYEHLVPGRNSRLDALQAAVLNVKLRHIDKWTEARRRVARWYAEGLSSIPQVRLPVEAKDARHVWHLYVVTVADRDALKAALQEKGIETSVHYPLPIHKLPAFADQPFARERFPNAEKLAATALSLPMCPTLGESEVACVVDAIRGHYR